MTYCSSDTVKISNIVYKEEPDGTLSEGDLEVSVQSSQYNDTTVRKAMIDAAAITAMQSAMGKNCYDQQFNTSAKRSSIASMARRWLLSRWAPSLEAVSEQMTMCMVSLFAAVQYLLEHWRQATDPKNEFMWLVATWDFKTPPSQGLSYEFIGALADALILVAPEFAPREIALGEDISAACVVAMEFTKH